MDNVKEKKLVTFQADRKEVEQFNSLYFSRSLFLRNCLKKAIKDSDFFYKIMNEKNNGGVNEN